MNNQEMWMFILYFWLLGSMILIGGTIKYGKKNDDGEISKLGNFLLNLAVYLTFILLSWLVFVIFLIDERIKEKK